MKIKVTNKLGVENIWTLIGKRKIDDQHYKFEVIDENGYCGEVEINTCAHTVEVLEENNDNLKELIKNKNDKQLNEQIVKIIVSYDKLNKQVENLINRNFALTSNYDCKIEMIEVYKEGLYITLSGCRAEKKFFVNNSNEVIRKPRNIELINKYLIATMYEKIEL